MIAVDGKFTIQKLSAQVVIEMDLPSRTMNVIVSNDELEERCKNLPSFEPKIKKGWLARYSKLVTNASKGGIMSI